ncbi:MAG: tetratricopeptide repeat protein [Deltaproteobacteria bacterium]|nr:tetratricopeptide repeat protein [Deltaproteobacteria bacterium]
MKSAIRTAFLVFLLLCVPARAFSQQDPWSDLTFQVWMFSQQQRYGNAPPVAEAEPLFMRALAIWEKELGPEHPQVGRILNNLAEVLYRRALTLWKKGLGEDHPQAAIGLNNLGALCDF